MIAVVRTSKELEGLRTMWNRLASAANARIFQTYAWCDAAWRFLDDGKNRLYVMVWSQENRTEIVIFPFYVDAAGTLRFIMDEHSDFCDCVYAPGVCPRKCMLNICTSRGAKLTSSSISERVDMITNSARSVHTCVHSSRFSTTIAKRRGMRPSVRDSFAV